MRTLIKLFLASAALCLCVAAHAAGDGYDVFVPISKYLAKGDSESLSAWFADTREVTIMSTTTDSSKDGVVRLKYTFRFREKFDEPNHD